MNVLFVRPPIYLWRSAGISTSTQNHRGMPMYMTMLASCLCQQDIIWAAFIEIRFLGILEKLGKIQRVHHFQTKMINFWTIFELGSDKSDLSVELPSRNRLNLITGSVLWAYRGTKKLEKLFHYWWIEFLMSWMLWQEVLTALDFMEQHLEHQI